MGSIGWRRKNVLINSRQRRNAHHDSRDAIALLGGRPPIVTLRGADILRSRLDSCRRYCFIIGAGCCGWR
jgi:hypothetical protein